MAGVSTLVAVFSLFLFGQCSNDYGDYSENSDMIVSFNVEPASGHIKVGEPLSITYVVNYNIKTEECVLNFIQINGEKLVMLGQSINPRIAKNFDVNKDYADDTKTAIEITINNLDGKGLGRELFGTYEVECRPKNNHPDGRSYSQTYDIKADVIPKQVVMKLFKNSEDVTIINDEQIPMSADYEGGYSIECSVKDSNQNSNIRLMLGEDLIESVQTSVIDEIAVIDEVEYKYQTTIISSDILQIPSKYHGQRISCTASTPQSLVGDVSVTEVAFIPEFDKVEPVLQCDQDTMAHIGQDNVKISCDLFAIPFVEDNRIRVQYPESSSTKKRNIKVRIAPSPTEDNRYVLTNNKIPNSAKFRLTLTIKKIYSQMFRDYKFVISRPDNAAITSTVKLIKDPSYKVLTVDNSATRNVSFLTVFIVAIVKLFLFN